VSWNGKQTTLFAKNQAVQLKIKLTVAEPAPTSHCPGNSQNHFQGRFQSLPSVRKNIQARNVLPNNVVTLSFSQDELSHLPANRTIAVLAEMRWLSSKTGREFKALGSLEIVLGNKYFVKEQESDSSTEQELKDMKRFRPFWNKVWEAPSLEAAGSKRDGKKYLWELDVDAKYSVLLSASHDANGLMETKLLKGQTDEEGLSERTEGRMKAASNWPSQN